MPDVSWEVRDEGTAELIQKFNQLTKAQQQMIVGGSKVSDQLRKTGREGAALKGVARGALEIAGALGVVTTAQGAVSAGFGMIQDQIRETVRMAKEAANAGERIDAARGKLLANDPNLTAQQRKVIAETVRRAAPSLGKEGAIQAESILADVRTGTPGASIEQQAEAFALQARRTAVTGVEDLGSLAPQAVANVKLQQALAAAGRPADAITAQNLLDVAGSRAGIDTSQAAQSLIPLISRTGATPEEKAALLAFGTAETGFAGERASTGIGTLLSKLAAPEFRDSATGAAFKLEGGDDKFARLENLLDRIQNGELNKDAALRATVGQNETLVPILEAMLAKRDTFRETLAATRAATAPGRNTTEELLAQAFEQSPGLRSSVKAREEAGRAALRQGENFQARSVGDVAEALQAQREGLGLTAFADVPFLSADQTLLRQSRNPGGLRGEENRLRLATLEQALGVRADVLPGAGRGVNLDTSRQDAFRKAFAQGGEEAALRTAVELGFVRPQDGISVAERSALQSVGVSDALLNGFQKAFEEGNRKMVQDLSAKLSADIARALAGELAKQKAARPAAQDLDN